MRPSIIFTLLLGCGLQTPDSAAGGPSNDTGDSPSEDICGPADDPAAGTALDIEGIPECGAPIFRLECGGCHGPNGEGTDAGPALAGLVVGHTDAQLLLFMLAGTGDMPAQGLGNRENAHVLSWLRATFGDHDGTGR